MKGAGLQNFDIYFSLIVNGYQQGFISRRETDSRLCLYPILRFP